MATVRIESFADLKRLIGPFAPPRVLPLDRIPPPRRPDELEENVVHARWGGEGASSFTGDRDGDGFHVRVTFGGRPPPPDPDPEPSVLVFEEVSREETEPIRVENPENTENWVAVRDIKSWTCLPAPELQRPADETWQFVFHPPERK